VVTVAATLALPVVASAQLRPPDEQRRSDQIQLMEGVLSKAVRLGAAEVNRRMQSIDPTLTVITGQARARGFVLEGYGIFFDVEVPTMSASAAWSMMTVQRDTAVAASLESLRRALASLPAGPKLQEAQQALQTVSRQVGPIQQSRGAADVAVPAVNTVVAANTSTAPLPPVRDDPDRQYTDAVKSALSGYVKVKFQAENPDDPATRRVMQRFNAPGLPTYVVIKPRT